MYLNVPSAPHKQQAWAPTPAQVHRDLTHLTIEALEPMQTGCTQQGCSGFFWLYPSVTYSQSQLWEHFSWTEPGISTEMHPGCGKLALQSSINTGTTDLAAPTANPLSLTQSCRPKSWARVGQVWFLLRPLPRLVNSTSCLCPHVVFPLCVPLS
jgi:hypothetical protein